MIGAALMAAGLAPAAAYPAVGPDAISASNYPGAPRAISDDTNASPYAMNYADEAAQNLGVRNGHMDIFSTQPAANQPYLPSFSGGLGAEGAMLKLQWHPGE